MKNFKQFDKAITMLQELYSMFHKSPLQRANLCATFDDMKLAKVYPLRIGGTRWLSHTEAALTNLFKGYPAFVQHLKKVNECYRLMSCTVFHWSISHTHCFLHLV
jgi:hypothetical protein